MKAAILPGRVCVYVCVEKGEDGCVANGFISKPFLLTCGNSR